MGTVQSISQDSLTIDSQEYDIEKTYLSKLKSIITVNQNGTFYLNRFNEICYYTSGDTNGYSYGYIAKANVDDVWEDEAWFKIFTSEGDMITVEAKEKIKIDGYSYSIVNAIDELKKAGGGYVSQLVAYKLNKDGDIVDIDTVLSNKSESGLRKTSSLGSKKYYAYTHGTIILPDIALKKGGIVFKVPSPAEADSATTNDYKIVTTLREGAEMTCSAYTMDTEGIYSDVVVWEGSGSVDNITYKTYPLMVCETYDALDEEGEVIKKIKLAGRRGDNYSAGVDDYVISKNFEVPEESILGDWYSSKHNNGKYSSYEDVSEGDIVVCNFDDKNEITKLILYFDYDSPTASISDIARYKGGLDTEGRFVAGYLNSKEGSFIATSTQGLGGESDELNIVSTNITIYDDERREDKFYIGSVDDLLAYDETSSTSSVVITFRANSAWTWEIFAYRNGLKND